MINHSQSNHSQSTHSQLTIPALLDGTSTRIMGHRGARGEVLENSRAGFEHLQQLSIRSHNKLVGVEFDVQLTSDGKLVVFHDDTLQRVYGSQSRIDQSNSHELLNKTSQSLAIGCHPIMLLEEMPSLLTGYQHIELEIKTNNRTNHQKLTQALAEILSLKTFIDLPLTLTSFDITLHQHLQRHGFLAQFNRGLLIEPLATQGNIVNTKVPLSQTPQIAMRLGCDSVGLYYSLYTQSMMQQCRRYNLSTTAWTVNSNEEAHRLIKLGVDYIITDYPSTMLNL